MKMLRKQIVIGTVFLVPVGNDLCVPGIVTYIGAQGLIFVTFGLTTVSCGSACETALLALYKSQHWRPFIGYLGFKRRAWKIVGTSEVPKDLKELPRFIVGYNEPPVTLDFKTLQPSAMVSYRPSDQVVEFRVAGDLFTEQYLKQVVLS